MQSVIIPPTSSGIFDNTNLEPQVLQMRTQNKANINIVASDAVLESDRTNILISSVKNIREQPQSLCRGIKRVTIGNIGITWVTPNVNIRNNTLTFFSVVSNMMHTVTITEGFYDTPAVLMQEVITQMNSVIGVSGLNFSLFPIPLSGGTRFEIVPATGTYYFDPNCDALKYGKNLYGFQTEIGTPVLERIKTVGPVFLVYTRFVDFCSSRLNAYSKIPDTTTGYSNNIIYRAYFNTGQITKPILIGSDTTTEVAKNFLYDDSLTVIDFQLRDEFGQFLYIPPYVQNFDWGLRLVVEF